MDWVYARETPGLCRTRTVGSDRGGGDQEKLGREVYGRREKRGWVAGYPKRWQPGEIGNNFSTLYNISQQERHTQAGPTTEEDDDKPLRK